MKLFLKNYWLFLVLAIFAFSAHLAFLSHPSQVVFDEVHFGKFVGAYFSGQYYFDIHPPLGKLMIASWAKLNGANPVFAFDHIGEAIPQNILFTLRFLPAFFGGLFVLAFAWLAYLINRSKIAALCAGFLILLDNAFLVQSKFILVDVFLVFFSVLAFCFFFLYQRQKTYSAKWFLFLILTGASFGLSISIKWTGLATIGILAVILFVKIFSKKLSGYLSPQEKIPFFGLCLGMQLATIEFARNKCDIKNATSAEFAGKSKTAEKLIDGMPEQKVLLREKIYGGTMRLGAYNCAVKPGTIAFKAYDGKDNNVLMISERHRHRYELNNDYRDILEKNGLVFSGINPEKDLVEIIELKDHPFFVATQFHPEFKSRPLIPHPLFKEFIKACLK